MGQGRAVGFIGLGNMGKPMALNLLEAGFPLVVWNRTEAKAEEVLEAGARWAATPRAVAEASDTVLTVLADAPAVREVLLGDEGVVHAAREGLTVVEMSTIAPADSVAVGEALGRAGVAYLDAPLSGSTQAAADAALTILVGGEAETLERVRPLLEAVGKRIFHMGPRGSGCYMKLVNNVILAAVLAGYAEAFVLGRKAGLEGHRIFDVVQAGSANCPLLASKGKAIADRNFSPTFALRMMRKDLALALKTAAGVGVPMPLTAAMKELHEAGLAQGLGDDDFSAIVRVFEGLAALD